MANFFVLFTTTEDKRPVLVHTKLFTGVQLKQFIATNGLPVGARIAQVQEVTFTVEKKQQTIDVDEITIGSVI